MSGLFTATAHLWQEECWRTVGSAVGKRSRSDSCRFISDLAQPVDRNQWFRIYVLGLGVVTATAFTQRIYGTGGLPGFIVGMLLVGAGTGTVKPNITVFLSRYWELDDLIFTGADYQQLTNYLKGNPKSWL